MRKNLTSLFVSAMMLSSLSLPINHSISMENKEIQEIDFASCLSDLNSVVFTKSIEKIISSVDTQTHFLENINTAPESLSCKKTLLALHKLFQLRGHMDIDLTPVSLFEIFSEGCKVYPESSVLNHCLAYCFSQEIGTKKDLEKAMQLYKIAMKGSFSYSFYNLALIYEHGKGVEKNVKKAIELYQKAVSLGNATAMNNLATMYKNGNGVEKNLEKAIELYEKAAELDNKDAMYILARVYHNGNHGVEKNLEKALALYQKAAEFGNKDAMYILACMYENGYDVEKNLKKAIELYEKAVELESSNAMYNFACMYRNGYDVEKNLPKAIELYQKAVNLGNPNAMNNLGYIYCTGNNVQKNLPKAIELYQKAVNLGNTSAMFNLACIYDTDEKPDIEKAQSLLEQAFFLGDSVAKQSLPFFLSKHKKITRLIELEFECSHVFPKCSDEFLELLRDKKNSQMIKETIESLIQKKYKEYLSIFLDGKKDHPLKEQKAKKPQPKRFEEDTGSLDGNDFFSRIPRLVVLHHITMHLDPQSVSAFSSVSKYFRNILCYRGIEANLSMGELLRLMNAFIRKIKDLSIDYGIEFSSLEDILNFKKIDEKEEQK